MYNAGTAGRRERGELRKLRKLNKIRNAPTTLMKQLNYGKGYQYAHDTQEKLTAMECLPDSMRGKEYYRPTQEGLEGRYKQRLDEIKAWKAKARQQAKKKEQ